MTKPLAVYQLMQQGLRDRLFDAKKRLEASLRRDVGQEEFGALVAKRLGEKPPAQATVSRWLKGELRDTVTIYAIAAVCGVSPGWLAFGEERPIVPILREKPKEERIVPTPDEPLREDRSRRSNRRRRHA